MLKFEYRGNKRADNRYTGHYYISTYPDPTDCSKLVNLQTTNVCREVFVMQYRHAINNLPVQALKIKKTYALISYGIPVEDLFDEWNTKIFDESQKGLFIVNSFEKAHKWPLTKLYPVECTNRKMPLVFFTGPRKWTMSPYLMSIWSLCIRLGRNWWLPKRLLTLDHKNLIRQLSIGAKCSTKHDARQVLLTLGKWDTFMSLYSKLFAGIDRKDHWSTVPLHGANARPEGIHKLMCGSTNHKELYNKYIELTEGA